ncbi:MAG: NAD(P)-dependent oxidoreductase [Anaerolineae bacterium]|nr:NAD(P)-dependent oxidoreductase [Anaerolineae bacterium]
MSGLPATILVTGAGGFVPRAITTALLRKGAHVVALDRQFDLPMVAAWRAISDRVTLLQGDVLDLPDEEVDAVIHGAALTASPEEAGQTVEDNLRANVLPLLHVLEWAQARGAGRILLISSSGVYRATPPGPVVETHPVSPEGTYAIAKAMAESLAETLKRVYRRDVVCIRLSSIYGEGEFPRPSRPRTSKVAQFVRQALESGRIDVSRPNEARDWTCAGDIAEVVTLLMAADAPAESLYNVASQEVRSNRQVADSVAAAIPGTEVYAREPSESDGPPLTRLGYLSNARLVQEFGFTGWTPFDVGIRRVVSATMHSMEAAS